MSTLQLFQYQSKNVRTVLIDDKPWFVAADISGILGYRDAPNMMRRIDDRDKGYSKVSTLCGGQKLSILNESGLYTAIFRSNAKSAEPFQRWVTSEVLPSIRETGSYSVAPPTLDFKNPATQRQLFEAGLAALNRAESAEAQLAIVAHKVEAFETFMGADNDFDVRDAAQLLHNDHGIDTGQNRLFAWLRDNKWIGKKDNRPLQHRLVAGLMDSKLSTYWITRADGTRQLADPQARITPKGLEYLRKKLSVEQAIPEQPALEAAPAVTRRKRKTLNP
jgi:anti-repressor protein